MKKRRSTCNVYDTRFYYFEKKTKTWVPKINGPSWEDIVSHSKRPSVTHVVNITLEDVNTGFTKPLILRRARRRLNASDTSSFEDILFDLNAGIECRDGAQVRLMGAVNAGRDPVDVLFKLRRVSGQITLAFTN